MRLRSAFPLLVLAVLVGSCANLGQPPAMPYDGLTRTSYGPLLPVAPQSCDPRAQGPQAGIAELSRQITALIAKPFSGISQVDPAIQNEGLTDSFRIPGDPALPLVVILSRDDNGILFWHMMDLVPISETAVAAGIFCGRRNRQAVWQGSAERCGAPSSAPLSINGQQVVTVPTQVITAYQCVPNARQPRRARS